MTCKHLIAQGAFSKFLHFLVGPNAENVSSNCVNFYIPATGNTRGYTGRREVGLVGVKGGGVRVVGDGMGCRCRVVQVSG